MKAVVLHRHGGPEVLELTERPVPSPASGEVLIRMKHAGIGRPDALMRTGVYPWTKDILPFWPGLFGAGVVAALGEGVDDLAVGQNVFVEHPVVCSCYAEYKTAPRRYVTPVPDGADLARASIATSSLIIWSMLTECFPAPEGKVLYIQGAAGSMGTAVLQIAPLLGMKVIASASTAEKCDYLRSVGGAEVFCYKENDPKQTVLALTNGRGADIIMDQSVGEEFIGEMDFLAPMGTILIYNNAHGNPSQNVVQAMVERFPACPAIRAFSFHYFDDKPELVTRKKQEMFALLAEGKIAPHIGARFAFDEVQKAHELLDSGNFFGGIVLDLE